jgi:hypothetical protein
MRVVLMCHAESKLNVDGIARWLASFADLVGVIAIAEGTDAKLRRVRNEVRRIGILRFLDVIAFQAYYRVLLNRRDARWLRGRLDELARRFELRQPSPEILRTTNPNSRQTEDFLKRLAPDMMIARCKFILRESVFSIPVCGTFVLHPGICPEYRNAHGAFWALATGDLTNAGLTLLKVDKGVDTGPVYGYYFCDFDEEKESHIVIMTRLLLDNLDALRHKLQQIRAGTAPVIETRGRSSAVWGQPWLTSYLRWKMHARRRRNARAHP